MLTGLEIGRVLRAWPFSPKFKLGASGLSTFCVDLRPPFHTDNLLAGLADDSYPQGTACMYTQRNIYHSSMHTRGIMHSPSFYFPVTSTAVLCLKLSIQRHVAGADIEITHRLDGSSNTHRVPTSNYIETNSASLRISRIFHARHSLQTQCMQLGTQRK